MVFNSVQYVVFLVAVLGSYWLLPRRAQNVLLLVASYVFYGAWDARFLVLIAVSTVVDYAVGRGLGDATGSRARRALVTTSVLVNLGILGYFKYAGFFSESLADLAGQVGLDLPVTTLQVVLPVGISFYTFQTMSYTIDVYRGRLRPARSFVDFATYVAFFPQLVAGPIERATNLLPQFAHDRRRIDRDQVRSALGLIGLGLVLKVVVADAVAPYVDDAYDASATAGGLHLLLATYGFAMQIYADFAGYTMIARGSARLLGVELMRNFEQPYLSRNVTDFWRTWHISLSTWLRDYLYIPLGGNRGGRWRTYRNLLVTMLLGGLWHGAAWNFVVWGGLHGLYLVAHRRFRSAGWERAVGIRQVPSIVVTFHAVALAWIFFRADSFTSARQVLTGIVTTRAGAVPSDLVVILVLAVTIVLLVDLSQRRADLQFPFPRWRAPVAGVAYALFGLAFVVFSGQAVQPFIYFQF